jgi:hypothetical protein
MMIQFWRLSEVGENNLDLACTTDGLLLGRTPLVERRGGSFVVRQRNEIERLFDGAYADAAAVERIMPGLGSVAAASNADDRCLTCIAAVNEWRSIRTTRTWHRIIGLDRPNRIP